MQAFIAYDDDRVVGRIAAILNNAHNEFNKVNDGFFGFFDCIDDQETADQLFEIAAKWLKGKGVDQKLIRPVNFSTNEACGLLIEGFDSAPFLMQTYNYPYYAGLIERAGFAKQVDLIAWHWVGGGYDDKSVRLLDALQERLKRNNIIIRKVNLKICETARNRMMSIWEVPRAVMYGAYGSPPVRSRNELRQIATVIWPVLAGTHARLFIQDAAVMGLHVQTERLFIIN